MGLILVFVAMSFKLRAEFLPRSFSANFEQEYVSLLKGETKKGKGSIDYMYPGNIRFETSTPSQVIFVTNGLKAWYYRAPFIEGESGEVTESTAKEATSSYTKFFDTLKNGLNSNSLYDVKKISDGVFAVNFKNKNVKEVGVKEATLSFMPIKSKSFSDLSRIDLQFVDGKKSTLKFNLVNVNPGFNADRFNFVAPAGTKVTR